MISLSANRLVRNSWTSPLFLGPEISTFYTSVSSPLALTSHVEHEDPSPRPAAVAAGESDWSPSEGRQHCHTSHSLHLALQRSDVSQCQSNGN